MAVLARPIILLLFPGTEIAVSSKILMIGAAAIVFFALSTLTNGVLQGIDRMIIPVVNAVLALAIHVFLVIIMLYYGKMSIYGLVIGNITYALTVCILNWFAIKRNAGYHQEILTTFIIPFAASGVMGICAYFTYMALIRLMGSSLVANGIATLFAVIVAVIVYTVVLVKLHGVSVEELYTFPKGASLVRLLKKCGLIRY
jgi:stage V sporulation protein B